MSTEQNKSLVRRYFEDIWGKGQSSLLGQFVAPDVCDHNPGPGQPRGLEGQRWFLEQIWRAVPDMQTTVDLLLAEGDTVMDHWTSSGTHAGDLFGFPASGKRFCISGTDMFRIANGKIAEMWHVEDTLSMMQQIGAVPPPPQMNQSGSTQGMQTRAHEAGGRNLSPDEKRDLIRRGYQEFIDRSNLAAADRLLTPDFQGHFSSSPPVQSREDFKNYVAMYNSAFTGSHAEVEDIVVEGDLAACRASFSGKHTANFMGLPPSGKGFRVTNLSLFRFAGDRVAEQWANNDDLGLLQQLGAIPAMAGAEMTTPC